MRTTSRLNRRGFTLIELLIVMTLLILLMGMAAGVFFRVQGGARARGNEVTLNKIHSNLEIRWKAVLQDAKDTLPADLVTALGDKDRALVVWTYAKLKNEFPQSFAEAKLDINFGVGPVLKPRKVFYDLATNYAAKAPPGGSDDANATSVAAKESAALLYVALTQSTIKGTVTGTEGLQQQVATDAPPDGDGLTYFKDGYGMPVAFIRHASSTQLSEIGGTPFTKASVVRYLAMTGGTAQDVKVFNSLDPAGKMIDRAPLVSNPSTFITNPWLNTLVNPTTAAANSTKRQQCLTALGQGLTLFDNVDAIGNPVNYVPTLVSAGGNKTFGSFLPSGDDLSDDNVLSFRLRREGARGD